jgi:hypothetical protein
MTVLKEYREGNWVWSIVQYIKKLEKLIEHTGKQSPKLLVPWFRNSNSSKKWKCWKISNLLKNGSKIAQKIQESTRINKFCSGTTHTMYTDSQKASERSGTKTEKIGLCQEYSSENQPEGCEKAEWSTYKWVGGRIGVDKPSWHIHRLAVSAWSAYDRNWKFLIIVWKRLIFE